MHSFTFLFQMEINLKDQIVVLDEAHNVEDSARDAASLTLTAVDLQNTLDDLDRLGINENTCSIAITTFGWAIRVCVVGNFRKR